MTARLSDRLLGAGALRHQVQIQQPVDVSDGQGGSTRTWRTIPDGTVWAAIHPTSGREPFIYGQLQMRVTHKLTLRYLGGVQAHQRILFNGRVFNIRSILNVDELNKQLVLYVEEGIPG